MTDDSARTAGPNPEHPGAEPHPHPSSTPSRPRGWHERISTRLLAMVGIVGIATILGAALVSKNVAGWIVGLVIGLTSAILATRLWSSRQT